MKNVYECDGAGFSIERIVTGIFLIIMFLLCAAPLVAAGDGTMKVIAVANANVSPIKIHTGRGSFLVDGINEPTAALIFSKDHWKAAIGNVTWFVDTQQGAKLTQSSTLAREGYSVALSADGNTLAAGADYYSASIGTVYVYVRSGATWTLQEQIPDPSDRNGNAWVGRSVALSADGNTLAVGGHRDASDIGATWIYTRTNGLWMQQGSKLVGTGAVVNARQGQSVALSADGNTLAEGGSIDDSFKGAVWIFTRTNGAWTQQGSKLVGSTGAVGDAYQGQSVALSADGNTLAEGGPADNSNSGAVWIFTRIGGLWMQQGSKLAGTGAVVNARQGESVALSADGNTLAEGGSIDDSFKGAVWIFTRTNGAWTQQGSKLVGSTGAVGDAYQGGSVALSADGNTLAEGGWRDNSYAGAVWIFTRIGGLWMQQGSKLVGTGAVGNAYQGWSVALSADGNTLATGGINDDDSAEGAVWVFV